MVPDIFLQKEVLGREIFFTDAHTLPCRTAFWGIDSHLRYWWQMYYAALFDVFYTPHKTFLQRLNAQWLHPNTHGLAQCAPQRPFISHAKRVHDLNFVGRLSGTRPERRRLCAFLQERYGIHHVDNISFEQMLSLYENTRIIPNESIVKEVNFRLMEGTACGCTLISPHVGEDQDCLFEPEREILIYRSMDEFSAHMERCMHDISFTEKLGRRAWIRVQKEHLAEHRAQSFLENLFTCPSISPRSAESYEPLFCRVSGAQEIQGASQAELGALSAFVLGLVHIFDTSKIPSLPPIMHALSAVPSLTLTFRIFTALQDVAQNRCSAQEAKERIYALLDEASLCLLGGKDRIIHKETLAVAAGGAALKYEDAPRSTFYLHLYEKIRSPQGASSPLKSLRGAQNALDVALNWVNILKRDNKQCFYGQNYVSGCCRTAFDFVSLCQELAPQDMRWFAGVSTLDQVLAVYPLDAQQYIQETIGT